MFPLSLFFAPENAIARDFLGTFRDSSSKMGAEEDLVRKKRPNNIFSGKKTGSIKGIMPIHARMVAEQKEGAREVDRRHGMFLVKQFEYKKAAGS